MTVVATASVDSDTRYYGKMSCASCYDLLYLAVGRKTSKCRLDKSDRWAWGTGTSHEEKVLAGKSWKGLAACAPLSLIDIAPQKRVSGGGDTRWRLPDWERGKQSRDFTPLNLFHTYPASAADLLSTYLRENHTSQLHPN